MHTKQNDYDGVKVFSATMTKTRNQLSQRITEWLADNPSFKVVDTIVTQSSDSAYHCLTLTVFYNSQA